MTAPTLAEQRQQLALALQPQPMGAYLAQLFAPPPSASPRRPLCHILDVKYEPDAQCTILYQLERQWLIGALDWRDPAPTPPATARLIQPLAMQVYPFADDPALPGLAGLLHEDHLRAALNAALPQCANGEQQVMRCRVTPLRYRPGKRCTLRLDLWLRHRDSRAVVAATCFGKLYHSAIKAAAVYDAMQQLAAAVDAQTHQLRAGAAHFGSAPHLETEPTCQPSLTVAQPVAFLPDFPLVLQAPRHGLPLDLLLSHPERMAATGAPRTDGGVILAAAALAELHRLPVRSDQLRPVALDVQKLERRCRPVQQINPALGRAMHELAQGLAATLDKLDCWGAASTLVHGDCKPSQFLIDPPHAVLLDFDHCGMADPASDVGMFLATLRQLNVFQGFKTRQSSAWLRGLEGIFLDAYQAGRPSDATLVKRAGWYQALALLRKAQRAFARSPRSPVPAALVAEGQRCLAGF